LRLRHHDLAARFTTGKRQRVHAGHPGANGGDQLVELTGRTPWPTMGPSIMFADRSTPVSFPCSGQRGASLVGSRLASVWHKKTLLPPLTERGPTWMCACCTSIPMEIPGFP